MMDKAKTSAGKAGLAAIAGALLIAAVAAGAWWWLNRSADKRPAGPPEVVTLAVSVAFPGSSLIAIADALGYFTAEGLQVTIEPYATGRESLDAAIAGKADFATVADIPFMFAIMKDAPVVVLATMATTAGEDYGIVARRDRGIGSVAALKGKKVGIFPGTSGHFFVDAMLVRQHLVSSQIQWVNLAPDNMAASLAAGEVDAIGAWEPYLGTVKDALGAKAEIFSAAGVYDSPWLLAARRDIVTGRADAVRRVLRALVRAERYYVSEPAAARSLLVAWRKEKPERVAKLLEPFRFDLRLGQSLLGALEDEARWAIRNKLVERKTVPNLLDHFYLDGMLAVRPESVTVIH